MHGYDLYRRYQAVLGHVWRMSQSQMYSILKRLEARGLVEKLVEEDPRDPSRRILVVTAPGLRHFTGWMLHPTDCGSRLMRLEFVSRLLFASMQGGGLVAYIVGEQAAAIDRQLANHEEILRGIPRDDVFNALSMDLRVRQLRASAEWLRDSVLPLVDAVPSGDPDGSGPP